LILEFGRCRSLADAIRDCEANPEIHGLILQSKSPTIFSAGLDLTELYKPDHDRLKLFWKEFQDLFLTLYGTTLACVAAIEGHAMAGGCMLAMACDHRIMTSSEGTRRPLIGLNETKLGIAAPEWLGNLLVDTVGRRRAEHSLQFGQLYSPEIALSIGLIDEEVRKEDVRGKAQDVLIKLLEIPQRGRIESKRLIRRDRLEAFEAKRKQDTDFFIDMITDNTIQRSLASYLESLATKNKTNK
jgi:Delta3-Delta2-enoyl-CoA isomerase